MCDSLICTRLETYVHLVYIISHLVTLIIILVTMHAKSLHYTDTGAEMNINFSIQIVWVVNLTNGTNSLNFNLVL